MAGVAVFSSLVSLLHDLSHSSFFALKSIFSSYFTTIIQRLLCSECACMYACMCVSLSVFVWFKCLKIDQYCEILCQIIDLSFVNNSMKRSVFYSRYICIQISSIFTIHVHIRMHRMMGSPFCLHCNKILFLVELRFLFARHPV